MMLGCSTCLRMLISSVARCSSFLTLRASRETILRATSSSMWSGSYESWYLRLYRLLRSFLFQADLHAGSDSV